MDINLGDIRYPNRTDIRRYLNICILSPIFLVYLNNFIQNINIDVIHGSKLYNINIVVDKVIYYLFKTHVKLFVTCINKSYIQILKTTTKLMCFYFQNFVSKPINRVTY